MWTVEVETTHIEVYLITSTMLVTHYNPIEEDDWDSDGQNGKTEVVLYTIDMTSGIVFALVKFCSQQAAIISCPCELLNTVYRLGRNMLKCWQFSVGLLVRQQPAALLTVGVCLQGGHQQAAMLEVCVGV